MRLDKHKRMLLARIFSAAALFAYATCAFSSNLGSKVKKIESDFERSSEISFYFVSRTEDYNLTESDLMKAATVKVVRRCGNSCASFMAPVIAHLSKAVPAKCEPRQQDILIVPNKGPSLMFSMSGRVLRYGGSCYFNETGVGTILKAGSFFFR